jgi:hypothetical protein
MATAPRGGLDNIAAVAEFARVSCHPAAGRLRNVITVFRYGWMTAPKMA